MKSVIAAASKQIFFAGLIYFFVIGFSAPASALDQINLHISAGISPNTLLYRFAKDKGFYREEGVEVLPIQAGMLPGIQGLVGGNFQVS